MTGSNRVDLSPSTSLHIRDPFTVRRRFPNLGRVGTVQAPCHPLDAWHSYLFHFLMRRPVSEDSFLFTSSRFGLLRSSVPERSAFLAECTSPPDFYPSYDFNQPRSRIVTLLSPCSPFGWVPALLPLPFLGRYQLQYPPSPGSWFHIAASPIPAQDCAEGFVGRLFTIQLL